MKNLLDRFLYYFFKGVLKVIYWALFRYTVEGAENVPSSGGVIIASNHLSYIDPPLIGIALKRRPLFVAKGSLFDNPLIGWFVRLYSLPIDRDNPKPSTLKEAVRALRSGRVLVIFPEGTRSSDGSIGEGKRGVGLLAALGRVPVVPTLVEGTERALPRGALFIRPAKVRVTFGRPIYYNREGTDEEFTKEIMQRIRELKASRCR